MHISKIKNKSADNLAVVDMPDDGYHNAIHDAAKILVGEGLGAYLYFGSTSAILWASPADPRTVIRSIAFSSIQKWAREQEVISEYREA